MGSISGLAPKHTTRSPFQVQILSDLHLEFGKQYLSFSFPVTAPFLLLAGDVGRLADYEGYLSFLQAQAARYRKVFLVLGNNEFFGLEYESALEAARRLVQESSLSCKVVLLHRSYWDDPDSDARILGCTLWSAVPAEATQAVVSKVKDFRMINGWSIEKHNENHTQEAAWLRSQVMESSTRQLLIATHHAPCIDGSSRPEQLSNPWTSAYATNLVDQGWEGVKVWVFGHTHYSTDFVRCGIRIIANQRGYVVTGDHIKREEVEKKTGPITFNPSMFITL